MRFCSWFLILLWVLKLSVGSVMAMPLLNVPHAAVQVDVSAAPIDHTAHSVPLPDCHGHLAVPSEQAASVAPSATGDTDRAPCAAHADCHHCCAVGWGTTTAMALHPAPAVHPTRIAQGWQSESWRPVLRPPIA
jgi:hypothetical protein